MIASVHLPDIGAGAALGVLRKPPRSGSIPGLRHANVALAAPLSRSLRPSPDLGRVGLIAFWDDDATPTGSWPAIPSLPEDWNAASI